MTGRCESPGECFDSRCDVDCRLILDDEFGLTMDPCEHPSLMGGICQACGATVCQCLTPNAAGHVPGCPLWEEKRA